MSDTKIDLSEGSEWRCTSCGTKTTVVEPEFEPDPDDPDNDEVPEPIGYPASYDPFTGVALCGGCYPGPGGAE